MFNPCLILSASPLSFFLYWVLKKKGGEEVFNVWMRLININREVNWKKLHSKYKKVNLLNKNKYSNIPQQHILESSALITLQITPTFRILTKLVERMAN